MNSNCYAPARTSGLSPRAPRPPFALSPQIRARQARLIGRPDRAYLKALRQAEMAAWEGPSSPARPAPAPAARVARLPRPERAAREEGLYWLLALLCLLTLGHELWTVFQRAGNWHHFAEFVRRLLT